MRRSRRTGTNFVALDKIKAAGFIPLAFGDQKVWEPRYVQHHPGRHRRARRLRRLLGKRDPAYIKSAEFRKIAETYRRFKELRRSRLVRPQLERRGSPCH